MNRYSLYIFAAAIAAAAPVSQGANPLVADIAPYVFPENRAAAPDGFTYMPDGKTYAVIAADGRGIECFDIRSGQSTGMLVDLGSTRETRLDAIDGFILSPDASQILMWTDTQPVYRRSFKARYYVYEVRSRLLRPLSAVHASQQSPVFSPDSRMVAFVSDNNIYVKKLDYQTEVAVTDDGAAGKVINGIPDWVYEEEFQTTCSMTWAPDNLTLCYLKYNETDVPTYDMTTYEGTCDPQTRYALYPGTWSYKYPVAGQPNSRTTLHSYDVETRKVKDITLPDTRIEYIPRIEYAPGDNRLIVSTLNRDQNHFEIYTVNPKSTVAKSIYTEDSRSWIDPVTYEDLTLLNDGFVVNSWRSGYNQIYLYSYAGAEMRQITSGDADVTAYYGCDAAGNHYYQIATPSPLDRTVRRIDRKGVVSDLSPAAGTAAAQFSPDMQYMMLTHSDVSHAPVYTLCTSAGKSVRTVEDNADYMARVGARAAKREFFTMSSDGNTLNGYIMRPTDFDASRKYPVVMYQYSGPGSQEVLNRWQIDWQDAFVRAGYVVMCVDGRGTGGRGRDFCDIVYRRLGYYETIDQIAAARYAASLPFVDPARIGIFGWSYGGYETLMAACDGNSPYSAAVAVAPVTDWRFYDTVYAERYMLTPQQNEDGYRQSAPLNRAAALSCPLLVMYGTADDNVHPANSLQFVSALQSAGVLCDMLVFPNMNHSINGCNARAVVYAKMLDWFNKNLK